MDPMRGMSGWLWTVLVACSGPTPAVRASVDFDGNGFVDRRDYRAFYGCLSVSGPSAEPAFGRCQEHFDSDADSDVDLADFAVFQQSLGHLPIPLRDARGEILTVGSTDPYSSRRTCGTSACHDVDHITNGFLFQQGRTDTTGRVDMKDDYHGDGRWWIKSSARYGKWGQSFQFFLAAKDNEDPTDIDQTTFAWIRDCGGCHVGGGPGEFDRDDELLYDQSTGMFGYERLGRNESDVALDGDYSVLDFATGEVTPARWDLTGLSDPDCLRCHRTERTVVDGVDMNFVWRKNVLAAGTNLVDGQGRAVPAFEAANTAGQGWFSTLSASTLPQSAASSCFGDTADSALLTPWAAAVTAPAAASVLQIDYGVGLSEGSLSLDNDGSLLLSGASVTRPPKDQACWGCHPYGTITGTVWFDDSNVHYRKFNRLGDDDPSNDIPAEESRVCTVCHTGDLDHNFGRGNSFQVQYRNDLDWQGLRHCRSCHIPTLPDGQPNPGKHPDAPDFPGDLIIHTKMEPPRDYLSCQACHIPYALSPALLFRDITIPGATGTTSQYLSADPLDPSNPDKSRWYPALLWKRDADDKMRLFPANVWITIYWADWRKNGTPGDLTDDVIAPIYTWRINRLIPEPLPVVSDDNGDGQLEINRPEEILAYIDILRGNNSRGEVLAENPVLVKGKWMWYEDPTAPGGVRGIMPEYTPIPFTWYSYRWGMDHNVRPKEEAWGGSNDDPQGCRDCHRSDTLDSPVWDRLILVDPYGPDGKPIYQTVREMTGKNPP